MNRERALPPALATWLLRHLSSKKDQEALTGDLFEKFGEGQSDGWFWRQVLIAILVGVALEFNALRWQICFAVVGTLVFWWCSWHGQLNRSRAIGPLFVWGVGLRWPLSAIYQTTLHYVLRSLMVLPILAVFLLVNRAFGWISVFRAFLLCMLLLPLGDVLAGSVAVQLGVGYPSPAFTTFWVIGSFSSLLISAWAGCRLPRRDEILNEDFIDIG